MFELLFKYLCPRRSKKTNFDIERRKEQRKTKREQNIVCEYRNNLPFFINDCLEYKERLEKFKPISTKHHYDDDMAKMAIIGINGATKVMIICKLVQELDAYDIDIIEAGLKKIKTSIIEMYLRFEKEKNEQKLHHRLYKGHYSIYVEEMSQYLYEIQQSTIRIWNLLHQKYPEEKINAAYNKIGLIIGEDVVVREKHAMKKHIEMSHDPTPSPK